MLENSRAEVKSPGILVTNNSNAANRFDNSPKSLFKVLFVFLTLSLYYLFKRLTKPRKESLDSVDFELIKLGLHKSTEDIRAQYLQVEHDGDRFQVDIMIISVDNDDDIITMMIQILAFF